MSEIKTKVTLVTAKEAQEAYTATKHIADKEKKEFMDRVIEKTDQEINRILELINSAVKKATETLETHVELIIRNKDQLEHIAVIKRTALLVRELVQEELLRNGYLNPQIKIDAEGTADQVITINFDY